MKLKTNLNVNALVPDYNQRQPRDSKGFAGLQKKTRARNIWQLLPTLLVGTLLLTMATPARSQNNNDQQNGQGGGNVLPPGARPHGYSLDEMAKLLALFNTSANNPQYYPKTPFQILALPYGNSNNPTYTPITCPPNPPGGLLVTGGNTFVVRPGTPLFVPIVSYDDSPTVVGVFPTHASQVEDYVFGTAGLGARNFTIAVDGDKTPVGPEFLAGPVSTPTLLDGGGTHLIELGVFLTPMSIGTHEVTIKGEVATSTAFSLVYGISCYAEDFTYTVKVAPGH